MDGLEALIEKLPMFDVAWNDELKDRWFSAFAFLWRKAREAGPPKNPALRSSPSGEGYGMGNSTVSLTQADTITPPILEE